MPIIVAVGHVIYLLHPKEKKELPFSIPIEKEELVPYFFANTRAWEQQE